MEDDIPWLDSSELVDADGELEKWAQSLDSLAPIELSMTPLVPMDVALPAVPKRSRAAFATLGVLGASLAALFFSTGSARVNAPTAQITTHTLSVAPPAAVPAAQPAAAPAAPAVIAAAHVAPVSTVGPAPTPKPARAASAHATATRAVLPAPTGRDGEVRAAFASLNAGQPREALKLARAIVDVAPDRADAWLVLGSAYDALHDRASAQAAFHTCAQHARGAAVASCKLLVRD